MKLFRTKWRVATDAYNGFEVQVRRWYFPVWIEFFTNTHPSFECAMIMILANKGDNDIVIQDLKRRKIEKIWK